LQDLRCVSLCGCRQGTDAVRFALTAGSKPWRRRCHRAQLSCPTEAIRPSGASPDLLTSMSALLHGSTQAPGVLERECSKDAKRQAHSSEAASAGDAVIDKSNGNGRYGPILDLARSKFMLSRMLSGAWAEYFSKKQNVGESRSIGNAAASASIQGKPRACESWRGTTNDESRPRTAHD